MTDYIAHIFNTINRWLSVSRSRVTIIIYGIVPFDLPFGYAHFDKLSAPQGASMGTTLNVRLLTNNNKLQLWIQY